MEDTAYITYFNEFNLPIVFTFYLSDHFIYEELPSTDSLSLQNIINKEFKLTCTFRIDGKIYAFAEYQNRLSGLYDRALTSIEKEFTYVPDKESFLKHIRKRISLCAELIDYHNGIVSKSNCRYEWLDNPAIPAEPLRQEAQMSDDYIKLFSPFLELQYSSLSSFNSQISRLFGSRVVKTANFGSKSIKLEYEDQYRDIALRREVIERIETLKYDLSANGLIEINNINSILLYFGIKKTGPKLYWKGNAGDFYTFNKRLKDLGILTGHSYHSLQQCIHIKDFENWQKFRSLKPTLNEAEIIRIVDRFKSQMDILLQRHST